MTLISFTWDLHPPPAHSMGLYLSSAQESAKVFAIENFSALTEVSADKVIFAFQ